MAPRNQKKKLYERSVNQVHLKVSEKIEKEGSCSILNTCTRILKIDVIGSSGFCLA
jgi:hypothetical protein